MMPEHTIVGERDGWEVSACTDALGAQVMCTKPGEETRLSPPLADHAAAIIAARAVVADGFGGIEWGGPIGNLGELALALIGAQS